MDHKYIELEDISSPKENVTDITDTINEENHLLQKDGDNIILSVDNERESEEIQENHSFNDYSSVLDRHPHEPLLSNKPNKDPIDIQLSSNSQQGIKNKITLKSLVSLDIELTAEVNT